MPEILSISCCINLNCSLTKICTNEVSHCKFVGIHLNNTEYSHSIRVFDMELSHFDCWPWSHEANLCPKTIGDCVSAYNYSNIKIFCCAGDLCNNPQNLTCEVKDNDFIRNGSIFPLDNSVSPTTFHDNNINNSTIISKSLIVLIILISIIVGVIFILHFTCKRNLSRIYYTVFKRPVTMNGGVSDGATYMSRLTKIDSSFDQMNSFLSTEVGKASDYYVKCERKCAGKFGEIWIGRQKSDSKARTVAIKIFRARDESSWETELQIYRYIRNRCQNILSYIGCDKIIIYNKITELWLVTRYMDHGSLYDYLVDTSINTRPNWSQLLRLCLDISVGLSYLHQDGSYQSVPHISGKPAIAHRDLKSRNVLIGRDLRARIADFGLAICFHGNLSTTELHVQVGTQRYMAPEVLEGSIHFSRDSFFSIDVYAMSLIFWELLTQCIDLEHDPSSSPITDTPVYKQPFEAELGIHVSMETLQVFIVNENKRPQLPNHYHDFEDGLSLWKTVVECWDRDAEARLSASCVCVRLRELSDKCAARESAMPKERNARLGQDSEPLLDTQMEL